MSKPLLFLERPRSGGADGWWGGEERPLTDRLLEMQGGGSVEKEKVDFHISPGWGRMRAREGGGGTAEQQDGTPN